MERDLRTFMRMPENPQEERNLQNKWAQGFPEETDINIESPAAQVILNEIFSEEILLQGKGLCDNIFHKFVRSHLISLQNQPKNLNEIMLNFL